MKKRYLDFIILVSIWLLYSELTIAQNILNRKILITEVFPDPTPSLGLPEREFVEIYNNTFDTLLLQGLQLCDRDRCFMFGDSKILPQQCLLLCKTSDIILFENYGAVLGFPSFISLNNDGDLIYLKNVNSDTLAIMNYESSMVEQGRTIILDNVYNQCYSTNNWMSSSFNTGGSPGKLEDIQVKIPKPSNDMILATELVEDSILKLSLKTPILPTAVPDVLCYLDDNLISPVGKNYNQKELILTLQLPRRLLRNFDYFLGLKGLKDCYANTILQDSSLIITATSPIDSADVVISEILFNPKVGGVDFVEITNTSSSKIIDLKNWKIANNTNNIEKLIFSKNHLLRPLGIVAITSDTNTLKSFYKNTGKLFQAEIPSFNDDKGNVSLISASGKLMDSMNYNEDMHFSMLKNVEGISLEKIYLKKSSLYLENWNSASEQSGFATPGLGNSQRKDGQNEEEAWEIDPVVFYPQAGINKDFTSILYKSNNLEHSLVSIFVYNYEGRMVKTISKNTTLSQQGFIKWDGTNDEGNIAAIGQYIIYIQVIDINGNTKSYKKQVVLGTL